MKIIERFSVNNDCYKNNVDKVDSRYTNFQNKGPQGLMLHSVGCSQDKALVFANLWNQRNYEVAVHAVLQDDGTVYQCLPWNFRGWHAGGAANNTHIGVEMTEPDCIRYVGGSTFTCSNFAAAKKQVKGTYDTAVELFAFLCKKYNLDPMKDGVIISHAEGCKRGVASNHGDPTHLWNQLDSGYTMDGFRKDVKAAMSGSTSTSNPAQVIMYRVRKSWADSKSQIGAYNNLENAKKACDDAGDGYYVFDKAGNVIYPIVATSVDFNVGDMIKLSAGAKYTNGKSIPKWVINSKLYAREIQGNNIVFSILKVGPITGVVNKKYIVGHEEEFKPYLVEVTVDVLNIRAGAGTNYAIKGKITDHGTYTIVEEKNGFGRLKSGAGWIYLDYTKKV